MKKIFNFALYDFANSAFTTIIITFIFATYFAKQIAPNPVMGQSYWGWTIGITGFLVAIIGPVAGSFADKKNKTRFMWSVGPYVTHRLFNPDLPLSMETGIEVGAGYQISNGLKDVPPGLPETARPAERASLLQSPSIKFSRV